MFYDFIISGGGLAGVLAYKILKKLNFSVYIFDKIKKKTEDKRTTFLSYDSKLFLEKLEIWQELEQFATPILDIYSYEFDTASYLHFDNRDDRENRNNNIDIESEKTIKEGREEKSPMGYVVPNQAIQDILYKDSNIEYNKLHKNIYSSNERVKIIFDDDTSIEGRFLIVAEGKDSSTIRNIIKRNIVSLTTIPFTKIPLINVPCFSRYSRYYKQCSIICNLQSEDTHKNIAREIFLPTGPVALLPLHDDNQFSLIWSTKFELANSIKNSDENTFLSYISTISNIKFSKILTDRISYDLSSSFSLTQYKNNIIFIGDTVHTIHPVAGQGFNLTIYDLKELFEILENYGINKLNQFLDVYSKQNFKRNASMLLFTDLLVRGFSNNSKIIKIGRNLAIDIINNNPKMRRFFIKRAMHSS